MSEEGNLQGREREKGEEEEEAAGGGGNMLCGGEEQRCLVWRLQLCVYCRGWSGTARVLGVHPKGQITFPRCQKDLQLPAEGSNEQSRDK